jgi:stage III sporulation protein SpoIIIAA
MTQLKITDDLQALLDVLPPDIRRAVEKADDSENLLEVILDLGRVPTARFVDREIVLRDTEVTRPEIDYVDERTGEFDADNRAGIERTLHRISAIRNRRGHIVGLTLRVGRAVYGTVDIIQDIIETGKSVLILGRPGVGKTTLLREAARILAESKRVVIVDTSNEIGGDGDVPHPAVGKARRMQVREPMLQHEVMIEAVENHNPEVIVIDEIGRELEAAAARTIAERGVQLIGTAHGRTLDNLLLNPTLSDLVGGIEAVTLSDEEARRRGTQKTVLERRAPPTFDVLVEIQNRDRFAVHTDILNSVDALLRGFPLLPEIRTRDLEGNIQIEEAVPAPPARLDAKETMTPRRGRQPAALQEPHYPAGAPDAERDQDLSIRSGEEPAAPGNQAAGGARDHRERSERGAGAGHAANVLPRPAAADHGCRAPRAADLCAALEHHRPDGAIPRGAIQPEGRARGHVGHRGREAADAAGHPSGAERRTLGGSAARSIAGAPARARDGAAGRAHQPLLRQGAAPARADIQGIEEGVSLEMDRGRTDVRPRC